MIKKIRRIGFSQKWIELLFTFLIISIPFGAHVLSFSIGFMTVFPFLMFLFPLTVLGFFHFKKIKSKFERYFLLFLFFWLLYAIVAFSFVESKTEALIDIRSLILMFLSSWIFIWTKNFLGIEKWKSILNKSFKWVYFLLLIFSVFEYVTGIHFIGAFTNKIVIDNADALIYCPVFLFDSPNNLVTYILLISGVILLLEKDVKKKSFLILFLLFSDLFISIVTYCRVGIFVSISSLFLFFILYLPSVMKWFNNPLHRMNKIYVLSIITACISIYLITPKYYGPIWTKSNIVEKQPGKRLGRTLIGKVLDYPLELTEAQTLTKDSLDNYCNSNRIRAGLFFNGVVINNKSNLLGAGPGQYRYLHSKRDIEYYTNTNISPHFWLIEILSQYGIIIFSIYLLYAFLIISVAIKLLKINYFKGGVILISIYIFVMSSVIPSSFLILDINWIFVAILVGVTSDIITKREKVKYVED